MTFKDYFSKNFETRDDHHIPSLKTHYYQGYKESIIEKVVKVLEDDMKCIIRDKNDRQGEIIIDASDFSGSVIITATSYTEIAVDMQVYTYNILPTAKGKKIIEKFYSILDKKLTLRGTGLYNNK